ncbi:MAG: hypothetical protein IPK52_06070 [Chloroflexi bacterium]|nr:hypothetical protein [Chloroflexota bacterium]
MLKWGYLLMFAGVVIAVLFVFLPLYAPDNALSKAMLTPLLCRSDENYVSDTAFGTGFDRAPNASLNSYCVAPSGERRDVSTSQINIGLFGGGIPFIVGLLLVLLTRFVATFRQAATMGSGSTTPFNPTNQSGPGEQAGRNGSEVGGLSEKLADVDAAYSARRISRDEYESLRKKIIDEATS